MNVANYHVHVQKTYASGAADLHHCIEKLHKEKDTVNAIHYFEPCLDTCQKIAEITRGITMKYPILSQT